MTVRFARLGLVAFNVFVALFCLYAALVAKTDAIMWLQLLLSAVNVACAALNISMWLKLDGGKKWIDEVAIPFVKNRVEF